MGQVQALEPRHGGEAEALQSPDVGEAGEPRGGGGQQVSSLHHPHLASSFSRMYKQEKINYKISKVMIPFINMLMLPIAKSQ